MNWYMLMLASSAILREKKLLIFSSLMEPGQVSWIKFASPLIPIVVVFLLFFQVYNGIVNPALFLRQILWQWCYVVTSKWYNRHCDFPNCCYFFFQSTYQQTQMVDFHAEAQKRCFPEYKVCNFCFLMQQGLSKFHFEHNSFEKRNRWIVFKISILCD